MIEVKATFFPLAFLLFFFKPTIVVDGVAHKAKWWDSYTFPVAAGRHSVKVFFKYMFLAEAGANTVEVTVSEGGTARVRYRAPLVIFLKGKIRAE